MAQDGGLLLGNLGHVGKVGLGHSQTVAVKIVIDAGAQVFLAPIDLVIFAGFGALDIVGTADEVIVSIGVVVTEKIPFQPAQDVHFAGIAFFQLGDRCLVQRRAALGHAILQVAGGVAVTAETQRLQASLPCGYCHFLQRIFAVAQFGMNVNGTFQVLPGHITASFPA